MEDGASHQEDIENIDGSQSVSAIVPVERLSDSDSISSAPTAPRNPSNMLNDTDFADGSSDSDDDMFSMSDDLYIIRNMIRETRRNVAMAEGSYERSNMRLFIVNGRRRRLRRFSTSSSYEENPYDGDSEIEKEQMTIEQEQKTNANAVIFDTNLPVQHLYFGTNMIRVPGVNYLDDNQYVKLRLYAHHHITFPGEVLPFMVDKLSSITEDHLDTQNGIMFGLCFPAMTFKDEVSGIGKLLYGVTCQIYEWGTDDCGRTLVKSRALQRFVTKVKGLNMPLEFITSNPRMKATGYVKILPETYLPEPLKCINMGSMNRFRGNKSMTARYKRFQAATMPWPSIVYEKQNTDRIIFKARALLARHNIEHMPTDPTQLSFWLLRNLLLTECILISAFKSETVNARFKLLASTFDEEAIFFCRMCGAHITSCHQLFAMSKHGVQSQYCNSEGYTQQTYTVYRVCDENVVFSGSYTAEFSWFPGYEWRIIVCKFCEHRLGWEYKAIDVNLIPNQFFGISSVGGQVRFIDI